MSVVRFSVRKYGACMNSAFDDCFHDFKRSIHSFRASCPREGSGRHQLLTNEYHATSRLWLSYVNTLTTLKWCLFHFQTAAKFCNTFEMLGMSSTATAVVSTIISKTYRTTPFVKRKVELRIGYILVCMLHEHRSYRSRGSEGVYTCVPTPKYCAASCNAKYRE